MDPRFGNDVDLPVNTNIPAEVSGAIGRIRAGAGSPRDQQLLMDYLEQNHASLSPQVQDALVAVISLAESAPQTSPQPSLGDYFGNFLSWGDQSRNVQGGSQVLPTNPPQPSGGIDLAQTSWNAGRDKLPSTIGLNQPPMAGVPRLPPIGLPGTSAAGGPGNVNPQGGIGLGMDIPTAPPIAGATTNRSGINVDPQRVPRSRRPGANGGGADWKGIEGAPGGSAFGNVNPNYLTMVAGSPDLAATMLAEQGLPEGRHAPATAAAMAPQVGSALAMAKSGLLGGGGRGHGLGGPASSRQQLSRAEGLITSLGPGASIDPAYVYSKSLRMARKTPVEDLGGDIGTQIKTTQDAILAPLKGLLDDDAYTATANMLEREAMTWVQGVANGEIDPNLLSYPEWIRRQKKQHYLGR